MMLITNKKITGNILKRIFICKYRCNFEVNKQNKNITEMLCNVCKTKLVRQTSTSEIIDLNRLEAEFKS